MTLSQIFGRQASLPVKILRTSTLVGALVYGIVAVIDNLPEEEYSAHQKDMLTEIFKDSLNLDKIQYKRSWVSDQINEYIGSDAFALGNTIHMHRRFDPDDNYIGRWIFIHENAHTWQNQNCNKYVPNLFEAFYEGLMGKTSSDDTYFYTLSADKDLSDYGVEQQASIIADYYQIQQGKHPIYLSFNQDYRRDGHLYQTVLENFLENPSYIRNHCQNILRHH